MKRSVLIFGVCIGTLVLIVLLVSISIVFSTKQYVYTDSTSVPETDVGLILGAAILRNGTLSPVLKDRADQAINLYNIGKIKKIIASGNNSSHTYNEVQPIRKYLLAHGVSESDIFSDYAGFDTYSSVYRTRDVFLANSVTIISQSFHLPRAVYIGRMLGLTVYGVSADNGHYKVNNYVREILADSKAVINILFDRKPMYTGGPFPISGDGRQTLPQPK